MTSLNSKLQTTHSLSSKPIPTSDIQLGNHSVALAIINVANIFCDHEIEIVNKCGGATEADIHTDVGVAVRKVVALV